MFVDAGGELYLGRRAEGSSMAITWIVKEDLIFAFRGDGKYIVGSLSKPKFERHEVQSTVL